MILVLGKDILTGQSCRVMKLYTGFARCADHDNDNMADDDNDDGHDDGDDDDCDDDDSHSLRCPDRIELN